MNCVRSCKLPNRVCTLFFVLTFLWTIKKMSSVHPYIVRFSYFRFLQYHFMLPQTFLKNFIKWVVSFRSYSNFKMPSLASGWSETFLASSLELLYVKWSDLTETFQICLVVTTIRRPSWQPCFWLAYTCSTIAWLEVTRQHNHGWFTMK
jgi:hypothetical protein